MVCYYVPSCQLSLSLCRDVRCKARNLPLARMKGNHNKDDHNIVPKLTPFRLCLANRQAVLDTRDLHVRAQPGLLAHDRITRAWMAQV